MRRAPSEPTAPWSPLTRRDPEGDAAHHASWQGKGGLGRGQQVAVWPPGVTDNCTGVHGAVLARASVMKLEGGAHT